MSNALSQLRNIGIIAHIDAGKTTVTERMLFLSGAKHRVGRVDFGTTETDSDPEEQERGITIYAACVKFRWGEYTINLLDTPGHVDFTAEVERCLRVLDGAVVVFSAREGVEAQSETVWRQANKYQVPRLIFINKLDREGADFYRVFDEIGPRLNAQPLALQIPIGQGPAHTSDPFRGVIDLVTMKALTFDAASEGKQVQVGEIPENLQEDAQIFREQLLEKLYGISNEMLELGLEEQPIPEELIRRTIRSATIAGLIQPVLCGAALQGMGVNPLLDSVGLYLPSPLDRPPVTGCDPQQPNKPLQRKPDPEEPICALVFKILPAKTGDNVWVRLYSGTLRGNSRLLNPNRDKKENVAQLWQIHATKRERDGQVDEVLAGDICCVIGPRFSITGDTLCDTRETILLPSIQFAHTVLSVAIEPESTADRKKLSEVLEMLKRQDPTFDARENEETGQTLISGMGELHLEVIQHRLTRDFGMKVKFYKPRVNYRETIQQTVEVVGQCNRQIGEKQLFARLKIRLEPAKDLSSTVRVRDLLPAESPLPPALRAAALEELNARAQGGGAIAGFPLSGIVISMLGADFNEQASDEVAFRIAAAEGIERGLHEAQPALLEPVMRVEVNTPADFLGEIVGDLQQRRGMISATDHRGLGAVVVAQTPLSELFGYSNAIRSLSQGRASASMEPAGYQVAPAHVAAGFVAS
jgi:elongation factor G